MTPTRSRYTVLRLIFALAVITYLDRLCISAAMPAIAAEFHLTPDQKGWIFSAFTIAYAAFEIPSGRLGVFPSDCLRSGARTPPHPRPIVTDAKVSRTP